MRNLSFSFREYNLHRLVGLTDYREHTAHPPAQFAHSNRNFDLVLCNTAAVLQCIVLEFGYKRIGGMVIDAAFALFVSDTVSFVFC